MEVNNYDFICQSFYMSQAGFLEDVGECNEYSSKAWEILGVECDYEEDPEAWADIMFSPSTGKQYAVCGNASVTAQSDFYYKELDSVQYVECRGKYLDEFGTKAEQQLEYLYESDVVVEDGESVTYRGKEPVIEDDCDNILCSNPLFDGFYRASGDISIAAYLVGCRHRYNYNETVLYWM